MNAGIDKISVVVPFFNAQTTLPLCICALQAQTARPVQIILVDNNSSDDSPGIAKEAAAQNPNLITYLLEKRRGPSFARNAGVRLANGDFIAFTDSDCVPDPGWLDAVLRAFDRSSAGAVAGRVVGFEPQDAVDKFHFLFTMASPPVPIIYKEFTIVSGGFPTANLSIRKDVVEAIHGFDEDMEIYSEDYDLCARVYKAGYNISYAPDATVYHQHRRSFSGTWRQSFGFGKGHAALLQRHFKRMIILDLPKFHYQSQKWPFRIWLDLQGADKKTAALAMLSFLWWPFLSLWAAYVLYLFFHLRSKLSQHGLQAGFLEKWYMVVLLLMKSFAVTMGRMYGSLRKRVLCL